MAPDRGDVAPIWRSEEEQAAAEARLHAALKGSGGGGTSDGMDERVTRLEKHVDQIAKDVGDLRVDVATLKENVRHLPTKPWMFATLSSLLVLSIAIIGLLIRFLPPAS